MQAKQLSVRFNPQGLHVQQDEPLAVARLSVSLPLELWERPSRWRPSPAATLLLNAVVPLSCPGGAVGDHMNQQQPEVQGLQEHAGSLSAVDDFSCWREQLRQCEVLRSQPRGQQAFR